MILYEQLKNINNFAQVYQYNSSNIRPFKKEV